MTMNKTKSRGVYNNILKYRSRILLLYVYTKGGMWALTSGVEWSILIFRVCCGDTCCLICMSNLYAIHPYCTELRMSLPSHNQPIPEFGSPSIGWLEGLARQQTGRLMIRAEAKINGNVLHYHWFMHQSQ